MSATNEVVPYEEKAGALSVGDVRAQVNLIQQVLREVMQEGQHYGRIPGTEKPTLLKAGAEKLCLTFRLDPQYEITEARDGIHLTVTSKCTLYHIPSGQRFGSGMGSCSTHESKYAYRQAAIKCPACWKETVIKGRPEYGGGWVCFAKKGGCGAKYKSGDKSIEDQPRGRVPNEDLADQYNTVLKMANKRSLVAAVLNATAASDIFTQDIEDNFAQGMNRPAPEMDDIPDLESAPAPAPSSPGSPVSPATPEAPAQDADQYVTPDQALELEAICNDYGITEAVKKHMELEAFRMVPRNRFEDLRAWIRRQGKLKEEKHAKSGTH